jgi:hypothetical protein
MADTGLPWELPYPLPTDLVRDGAAAIQALAEATANGLDNAETTDASVLTTGTLPAGRISGTYSGLTGTGTLAAGAISSGFGNVNIGTSTFTGNGSGLTTLNASNLSSGTVNVARLPAAALTAGIGSNVVQTVKTNTFSTTSTSFTTVTGMSATITPTTNTSRILVIADVVLTGATSNHVHLRLVRGTTAIYIGDADGSRERGGLNVFSGTGANAIYGALSTPARALTFLDSPATTAARTYSVQIRAGAGTAFLNRTGVDANNGNTGRVASSITLIEVAA